MRLRLILISLSLLALAAAAVGGYLYYSSVKEAIFTEAERQAQTRLAMIGKNLSSYLSENIKPVKTLAGMQALREALIQPDAASLAKANAILDHFKNTLAVEVCYFMDRRALTIASSNRRDPDSFVGQNFAFRPYFKEAMQGRPATYLALGTASSRRGAYYSHPVYDQSGRRLLGVVVIKTSIEQIEELISSGEGLVLITDPHGVIFASNRPDWLLKTLWELPPEKASRLAASMQFGPGPWDWTGLKLIDQGSAVDSSGKKYLVGQLELDQYPGWQVVQLRGPRTVAKILSDPLLQTTGLIMGLLCLTVGLSAGLLYWRAHHDLHRRQEAEAALREAQEELSRHAQDLERQVRKRTREIASIFKYTPAVVYLKDAQGRYLLVNPRFEELFGFRLEEVKGKTDHQLFPKGVADQLRGHDLQVLDQGRPTQVEEQVYHQDGLRTYLSVKFPLFDEAGAVSGLCGISADITSIKKAQDQLKALSGSIMANQESERALLARELHDELGQLLTALQMDCTWMRGRLKGDDPKAAERAQTMCNLIDRTIEEVRSLAVRLRPGVLDKLGLVDALEWFTSDFEKRTGITCIFEHQQVPAIDDKVATAAYRIAQEALTNVVRHAQAALVNVLLQGQDGALTLEVSDNGQGFDPESLTELEGLGLMGMRERASLVGGELAVDSRAGQGTRVYFKVPF